MKRCTEEYLALHKKIKEVQDQLKSQKEKELEGRKQHLCTNICCTDLDLEATSDFHESTAEREYLRNPILAIPILEVLYQPSHYLGNISVNPAASKLKDSLSKNCGV
jgi:hypothetical protein